MDDFQAILDEVMTAVLPVVGQGRVANYIPALAAVDPSRFGMALATLDGQVFGVGDWRTPFSVQSISKVFALALTLARDGDALWRRVGKEPSGNPFNSLVQLEYEQGVPRNPFINAGALVVTDRLLSLTGDSRGLLREFLREESGNASVDFDPVVAASEAEHGHRNSALAHFMASYGNIENPVPRVLEHYFWQCSLRMSCADLARACGFLARHGQGASGRRLLTRSQAKQVNAVMLTCGTYDAAGEFAYRVGLPCKSGVGGGIIAVIPNRCGLCVWSPGLDAHGNSVAGVEALDRFTTLTGLSVF
ncbi:glutaminase [Myxococcus sp. MISCRS1]|jgi:glutaminase|uniref:glutaminase n=1 Tax=Myxococcus TaxID=32 RepID=UPI001CBDCBDE|nr:MULTISPECIES: glutaminase [Myxococcus]BDT36172.1 glutaminase [Myxococcus sp. MH1]MBZ4398800.1 glutaminase [Myxococcus sp. AS-1-15]MBZ4407060.1 glutaminase [Myxococcus sp. XM-1-1-1]MCK8502637.1 glutaminase [Myxococcus fulvus]MCY1002256.1 glutaminase [Myxococcus sp. MISCRS1]